MHSSPRTASPPLSPAPLKASFSASPFVPPARFASRAAVSRASAWGRGWERGLEAEKKEGMEAFLDAAEAAAWRLRAERSPPKEVTALALGGRRGGGEETASSGGGDGGMERGGRESEKAESGSEIRQQALKE